MNIHVEYNMHYVSSFAGYPCGFPFLVLGAQGKAWPRMRMAMPWPRRPLGE